MVIVNFIYLKTNYDIMKQSIFFIYFLALISLTFSQEKTTSFPENAVGIYKGVLHINASGRTQEIPMEFHLKKTDSAHKFDYILVYNKQPRNYTLIVKNKEKGIYTIDENNGIVIPAKFANKTLYSFFEVQKNFLSTRFEFSKNQLDFEILFTATKNKITSGGTSKEIPKVFGFPILTIQKAVLKKME